MKPIRLLPILAILLGLSLAGDVLAQAGTGNLYRVTSKMEIVGMPFQMPAQTSEVCGPKDQSSEQMVPRDKNCTVSNFQVVGNKSTFTMTCTGEHAMTATGEFERLSADAYRGRMHMQGQMEGQAMDMTMNFDGQRLRDCNYATESPAARGREMMAQSCGQMLSAPGYPYAMQMQFVGPDAMCASDKPKFCGRVTPLATDLPALREAMASDAQMRGSAPAGLGLWEAFQGCGLGRAAVITKACQKAEQVNDYDFLGASCPDVVARLCPTADATRQGEFVARYCPVQAAAIAKTNCVARGFTADATSPYNRFCSAYSAQRLRTGAPAGSVPPAGQPAAAAEPAAEPKKPSWSDRVRSVIGG